MLDPTYDLANGSELFKNGDAYPNARLQSVNTNHSLLVFANLTEPLSVSLRPELPSRRNSKQDLYRYYTTMFDRNVWLHKYGLVRMIAWIPENDVAGLIPRSVVRRSRQSIRFELFTDLHEVASGSYDHAGKTQTRRHYDLDVESEVLVRQSVAADKIWHPQHRQPNPIQPPIAALNIYDEVDRARMAISPDRQPWHKKLVASEKAPTRAPSQSQKSQPTGAQKSYAAIEQEKYKELRELESRSSTEHKRYKACLALATRQRHLDQQQHSLNNAEARIEEQGEKFQELLNEMANIQKEIDGMIRDSRDFVNRCIDDARAFDHIPPVLTWDHRRAEPLVVRDEEFHPKSPLTLLDIRPRLDPISHMDSLEKLICFEFVCATLLAVSKSTLYDALGAMLQGGVDEFIEHVPSLKGGSNASQAILQYRVRSLPADLFLEIAMAWETWPFRPPAEEMLSRTSDTDGVKFK